MKYMGNTIAKYEYDVAQNSAQRPNQVCWCQLDIPNVGSRLKKCPRSQKNTQGGISIGGGTSVGWHQCWTLVALVALVLDTCGTCGTSVGHGGIETKIKSLQRAGK